MVFPIIAMVGNRLKGLVLWLLGVLKRAFCCFRRRRRLSVDTVQLSEVGVVPTHNPPMYGELQSWSKWEEDAPDCVVTGQRSQPNSVQEHIELYRQQKLAATLGLNKNENGEDTDYFQDMVPRITRQKRILLKQAEMEEASLANARLKLNVQPAALIGVEELKEWEENVGWEDEARDCDETADMILREQRRLEREKKAAEKLQKRMERQCRPPALGARLS